MRSSRTGFEHGKAFCRAPPFDDLKIHLPDTPAVDVAVAGMEKVDLVLPHHGRPVIVNDVDFARLDDLELGAEREA